MVQRIIHDCDLCGQQCEFFYIAGREDGGPRKELCHKCAKKLCHDLDFVFALQSHFFDPLAPDAPGKLALWATPRIMTGISILWPEKTSDHACTEA